MANYDGGQDERDAIIDDLATGTAAQLRMLVTQRHREIEAVWAGVAEPDWSRPVLFRNADIAFTMLTRWREVWIHMVDLDLGVSPAEWPSDFALHVVDFLHTRLPASVMVMATDIAKSWATSPSLPATTTVIGDVRELAAWLADRGPIEALDVDGFVPNLGPWPPEPVPTRARVP